MGNSHAITVKTTEIEILLTKGKEWIRGKGMGSSQINLGNTVMETREEGTRVMENGRRMHKWRSEAGKGQGTSVSSEFTEW